MTPTTDQAQAPAQPRRLRGRALPVEGDQGLFSEGWYPVCASTDVPDRGIHSAPIFGGKVIVFRVAGGEVRVLSAYCLHLGADLAVGEHTDRGVRCAFHQWEYDGDGRCVALASGDPLPPRANLYRFHAVERFGIVFVYNGEKPLYDLPTFEVADADLIFQTRVFPDLFPVDPWVISANTPDLLHLTALHRFEMLNDAYDEVRWTDYSAIFPVHAKLPSGQVLDVEATIHGTNFFVQTGTLDGRWYIWAAPMGIPAAGKTQLFTFVATQREEGESVEDVHRYIDSIYEFEMAIAAEDMPIFETMRYTPGYLTRGDRILSRFFEYLRHFPRANPAGDFIN